MVTSCSRDGTDSSQGVVHVWSLLVRISAPGGSDSNFNAWTCSDEEFDDSVEEQPVSETPVTAATAMASPTRDMTHSLLLCATEPSRGVAPFSQSEKLG
jgi:hypothetical protein